MGSDLSVFRHTSHKLGGDGQENFDGDWNLIGDQSLNVPPFSNFKLIFYDNDNTSLKFYYFSQFYVYLIFERMFCNATFSLVRILVTN